MLGHRRLARILRAGMTHRQSGTQQKKKRPSDFLERLEDKMVARLAAAPERSLIPLAKMVLLKECHASVADLNKSQLVMES